MIGVKASVGDKVIIRGKHLGEADRHGEVIEVAGDCFGDAVNVSARLLDHAGDNETLITSQTLAVLAPDVRERFRRLERLHLRGRVEPVEVWRSAR